MIVVSVGTNEAPFDRLLDWVAGIDLDEELVVQHGPSPVRPVRARCRDFMPYVELVELVRASRVFVTHAGVGSIVVGLSVGRRPVVVPRLARFGEAVDDHQAALAHRLCDAGLVTLAEDADGLARAVAERDHGVHLPLGATTLQRDVHAYLAALRPARASGGR